MNHNYNPVVQAALRHVNQIFPMVTQVFFSTDGRWLYCNGEFEAPSFDGKVDVSLLEDAADAAEKVTDFPCGFTLITLESYYALWDELGNTPVSDGSNGIEVDAIEEAFLHFPVGTHREEIWHWFEAQHPDFVVGEVLQGIRRARPAKPALSPFISEVFTENTGGGVMVDFIMLPDRRVIGVNSESVLLYKSLDAFFNQGSDEEILFSIPQTSDDGVKPEIDKDRLGTFIVRIDHEYTVDAVVHESGMIIGIDSEAVCLYSTLESLFEGEDPIQRIDL